MSRATILSYESIEEYRTWLSERGKSDNTLKAYRSDLHEFLRWASLPSIDLIELGPWSMKWINTFRRMVAPKTTNRRMTSIRGFAKWAGIPDPLEGYEAPPVPKSFPHPIPEGRHGVLKMINQASTDEGKALIALCGLEGTRITEARTITPRSFDLPNMMLRIFGKGEKYRDVPLSKEAWTYIGLAYVSAFAVSMDTPLVKMVDRTARYHITRCAHKAGLSRPVSSHDLRATFATEVYNRTGDIRLVQELLGHESVETTQIYVGVLLSKMRDAVNFLEDD